MIERFFRSLKEECVWQHSFPSFVEARRAVRRWIRWYNQERPHQALGYLKPARFSRSTTATCGLTAGEHYMIDLRAAEGRLPACDPVAPIELALHRSGERQHRIGQVHTCRSR